MSVFKKAPQLLIFLLIVATACQTSKTKTPLSETNDRIEKIISQMTVEEKAGQMLLVALDAVSVGELYNLEKPHRLDSIKLRKAICDYHIGAIQNAGGMPHTTEHWYEIVSEIQEVATTETKHKIPILYGIDAVRGMAFAHEATFFPHQIALAASFDRKMARKVAEITAFETRNCGIPLTFSPVIDVCRNPVWSRIYETFGEDIYVTTELGREMILGYQGDKEFTDVSVCLKHFIGYGIPHSGKDRTPAYIPERQLREIYIPPFIEAIEAGAKAIMVNSGSINGIPTHADYHLLTEILRNELGFKGVIISDWDDINYLYKNHRIAKDNRESVKLAVMAGLDVSMVAEDFTFVESLTDLVAKGEIPESRLDESVRRILKLKFDLGLFDTPFTKGENRTNITPDEFSEINKQAAIDAITLLKNNNDILPISKNAKVLITGPAANSMQALDGGWAYTWQGTDTDIHAKDKNTIVEAISQKLGSENVKYIEGCSFDADINTKEAVKAGKNSDVIIACIGESSYTEKMGDIRDLYMSESQTNLIQELSKTGKPIILILVEGRPRIISKFEEKTNAVLMAYLPGNQGGNAIADVLFGDANPSGRLPFTYPKYPNDLLTYDHMHIEEVDANFGANGFSPQFEFGDGLSYTTFEYSDLQVSKTEFTENETLTVSVKITNAGDRAGKEAVLMYISDLYASVTPPVMRLKGFEKISLQASESKTVKFEIDKNTLSFIGIDNKRITEPGDFVIRIGDLTETITLK